MVAVVLHALAAFGMVVSPIRSTPEPVVMARAQSPTMIFGREDMQLNKPRLHQVMKVKPSLDAAVGQPPPPPPSNGGRGDGGRGDGGDGDDLSLNPFAVVLAAAAAAGGYKGWPILAETELLYILRSLKVNFGLVEATLGAARAIA